MTGKTYAESSSLQDFTVRDQNDAPIFVVAGGASAAVLDRYAGRTVVATDGVFADDGVDLTALGGGGGGVSDPLTVGPVTIGTGVGSGYDGVLVGVYGDDYAFVTTGFEGRGPLFRSEVNGDGAYADASLYTTRTPGVADSGTAQFQAETNTAIIQAIARDNADTSLTVRSTATGSSTFADLGKTVAAPGAPVSDTGRIFVRDNGSGKMQFCALFPTGAVQIIATEP